MLITKCETKNNNVTVLKYSTSDKFVYPQIYPDWMLKDKKSVLIFYIRVINLISVSEVLQFDW